MTARTNQIGREKEHPADSLIGKVLSRLNPGKAGGLVEKSLLWAGQPRNSSIRLCGVTLLKLILQHSQIKLNQAFLDRHVLG